MRPGTIAPPDSGEKCYREPGEPKDERPSLRIREFWQSAEEASAYLTAVRNHPREVDVERDQIESSMAYIRRIAGIVARGPLGAAVQRMPSRRQEHAHPPKQTPEAPYEQRLATIFAPERSPGEEG
jgi:hypothetical protein